MHRRIRSARACRVLNPGKPGAMGVLTSATRAYFGLSLSLSLSLSSDFFDLSVEELRFGSFGFGAGVKRAVFGTHLFG